MITSCTYQYKLKSSNEFIKQSNLVRCTSGWQRLGREGVGIWDIILQDSLTQRPCQAPRKSIYTGTNNQHKWRDTQLMCHTTWVSLYSVINSLVIVLSLVYTKYQSSSCPSPRRPPSPLPQVYISPSRLSTATWCGPQPINTTSTLSSFSVEGMGTNIKEMCILVTDYMWVC